MYFAGHSFGAGTERREAELAATRSGGDHLRRQDRRGGDAAPPPKDRLRAPPPGPRGGTGRASRPGATPRTGEAPPGDVARVDAQRIEEGDADARRRSGGGPLQRPEEGEGVGSATRERTRGADAALEGEARTGEATGGGGRSREERQGGRRGAAPEAEAGPEKDESECRVVVETVETVRGVAGAAEGHSDPAGTTESGQPRKGDDQTAEEPAGGPGVRQSCSRQGEAEPGGGPVRDADLLGGGQQDEARRRAKGHSAEQRKDRPPEPAGGERRGTSRGVEEVQSGRPADVARSDRPAGTGVAGVGAGSGAQPAQGPTGRTHDETGVGREHGRRLLQPPGQEVTLARSPARTR
jgi:hypothetical protein